MTINRITTQLRTTDQVWQRFDQTGTKPAHDSQRQRVENACHPSSPHVTHSSTGTPAMPGHAPRFAATSLANACFEDVNLAAAQFIDVNLADAAFRDVSLIGAKFCDVNLSRVAIVDANLAGMTINGVLVTELLLAHARHSTAR